MEQSVQGKKDKVLAASGVHIQADKHLFALTGDVLGLLERAAVDIIPAFRDDKAGDTLAIRNAQVNDTPPSSPWSYSFVGGCLGARCLALLHPESV